MHNKAKFIFIEILEIKNIKITLTFKNLSNTRIETLQGARIILIIRLILYSLQKKNKKC
jgi:hypothetical protein